MKAFLSAIAALFLSSVIYASQIKITPEELSVRQTSIMAADSTLSASCSSFTNPVCSSDCPDPTIWKDQSLGLFYCTATGTDRILLASPDLVKWNAVDSHRVIPVADKTEAKKVGKHFWAPDVIKIGGYWNMYLSLVSPDSGIGLFRSKTEAGPFEYYGIITHYDQTDIGDSIDPDVVIEPETEKVWLFFGSTSRMHRVELNSEGTALADGAEYVHVAGLRYSEDTTRTKVFEAAYLHRHGDWWYLFASGGCYYNYTYRIVVGRSKSLTGTFVDREGRPMTEGYATDVISSDKGDTFYGPGHNSEIFTDSTGQDYILYHCHNDNVDGVAWHRFLMLQRLFWDKDGWPYVEGGKPLESDVAPKWASQ